MLKEDKYFVNSVVSRLKKNKSSNFLDPREFSMVTSELNKQKIYYEVFIPYKDAEKVILYNFESPDVVVFEIKSKENVNHRDVLGSLFGLNLEKDVFGDIIVDEGIYIMVLGHMKDYVKYNLNKIGKYNVELIERSLDVISCFERKFEEKSISATSNRIDLVISKIIGKSRNEVSYLINSKQVFLNYDILTKHIHFLKPGDVFSIRGFGKYRYLDCNLSSKSGKYIINYQKYI